MPADTAVIFHIAERLAAFKPPPWRTREELYEGEIRTLRAFFEAPPPGHACFVAEGSSGQILGFTLLETGRDYFTGVEHAHLGIVAVAEEGEGKGIGSALIRHAEAWAKGRGYAKITLNVFKANTHARTVYERLGWENETMRYVKILT